MNSLNSNNPLVSVIVITYNSSKTVRETLDSVKAQTYQNLELIISDDCSKDNTVDICRDWLADNGSRFIETELITIETNTGTSANLNRGIKSSHGKWIKSIAGDDRLLPNCVSDNVDYVSVHAKASFVFSKVVPIGNVEEGRKWPWLDVSLLFERLTQRQIRILLCGRNFLPAASVFIRRDSFEKLGGYDESIPLLEDWPMWMKAVNSGYELSFMNKETAGYRFGYTSISQGTANPKYLESSSRCRILGEHYLRDINLFSRFYFFTMTYANDGVLMKLLHCINVVNPFFYEYNNSLRRFEELKTEMLNNLS